MMTIRRTPKPDLPGDAEARQAQFAKPQFQKSFDAQIDTSALPLSKIQPLRDPEFLRWLTREACSIKSHQKHPYCWNPNSRGRLNDPAHCGKAYSGNLKRSDAEAFTLCRLAHNEQERNADAFDRKYGIDRYAVAAEQRAKYLAEKERRA